MGSRMNAGYLITDSIHIGTTEFGLGEYSGTVHVCDMGLSGK